MPHYTVSTDPSGIVTQILKDGEPCSETITMEPVYGIVSTYFVLSRLNIEAMNESEDNQKRFYGLQAFIMALTGVEAFSNVFFHLQARQRNRPDILKLVKKKPCLVERLKRLIDLTFSRRIEDHEVIFGKIRGLYRLRNTIVHPRWDPGSVHVDSSSPLISEDFVVNHQKYLEDQMFCIEAVEWCLLLVCRIGEVAGQTDPSSFCSAWTGINGLNVADLAARLLGQHQEPVSE